MGKSALDFDDIQAAENRRREVAVLQGASPRATKYEDSPLKQMIGKYAKETLPEVAKEFAEYQRTTALQGYNFVSGIQDEESFKKAQEQMEKLEDQLAEANENEFKVTDTSTGLPRPEPRLTDEQKEEQEERKKREKEQRETEREQREKNRPEPQKEQPKPTPGQVSPVGSGDVRSAAATQKK